MEDSKFRSRRFILASAAMLIGGLCALIGSIAAYRGAVPADVAAIIDSFAWLAAGVLGAYGYTRSKWGANDDVAG